MEDGLKVFGSAARTRVVVAAVALRETYPREVARLTDVPLVTVQRFAVGTALHREGALAVLWRERTFYG